LSRIYASLPLTGPAARAGREVLRGAEPAAERASDSGAEPVVLDGFGKDREEQAIANARQAVADADALAYLGDFHSSSSRGDGADPCGSRPP
jgi:ABC-type branched-subunit amino acid transport system substrate-binding protein